MTARSRTATSWLRSATYSNWIVIRALDGIDSLLTTRIYPLVAAADPPETGFVNFAESSFNGIHSNDFSFFEEVNSIVQEEPVGALDPERAGQLAAIGIVHGQPFEPDAPPARHPRPGGQDRGRASSARCCTSPGTVALTSTTIRSWKTAFVGGSHEFLADGARLLDFRAMMHYVGTGITPAMTHAAVGVGSQYAYTAEDANGAWLDGAKNYTLTLPAPIPVKTFWAIDIYDTQTRSLLQTDNPYPSIHNRDRRPPHRRQRRHHHPLRAQPTTRSRRQLATNHPRQKLVSVQVVVGGVLAAPVCVGDHAGHGMVTAASGDSHAEGVQDETRFACGRPSSSPPAGGYPGPGSRPDTTSLPESGYT